MKFSEKYYHDEVRDGFYISGMMKRFWAAQLEVLEEVDWVCKRHGIRWFADCGTLLGAVRHGGYVPWDDDLDICMLRDDYQKFLYYAQQELPEDFEIMTYENESYWQIIGRVVNRHGISVDEKELETYHDCPYCCGIDIFLLDYMAPTEAEEESRISMINSVLALTATDFIDFSNLSEEEEELLRIVEEVSRVTIDRENHTKLQLFRLADRLAALYPAEGAEYVVQMSFWIENRSHKYPMDWYRQETQLPFEETMINVPASYDEVLRVLYGDFLRISKKGGLHDYPLYQYQEDVLMKEAEVVRQQFRYQFQESDLTPNRQPRPKQLRERAEDICEAMEKLHQQMRLLYEAGEGDTLYQLLIGAQDAAISLGTMIEQEMGESIATIHEIETYCEKLFQIAERSATQPIQETDEIFGTAEKQLSSVRKSIQQEIPLRREVVFFPFDGALWGAMDSLWRAACEEPNTDVYVVPLPYYDRGFLGNFREMHYDTGSYPADVPLTHYDAYDVEQRHPDVIYTQYPYDNYNYTYSIPMRYYTEELKKHTEQLVYVPYFLLSEPDPEELKSKQTYDYFVKIPGLMHADRVILQSDAMREAYIECLCDFCGEDTRSVWEAKIEGTGSPIVKWRERFDKSLLVLPEGWDKVLRREDGSWKKVVLYCTTVSMMYQFRKNGQALRKIRYVLQTFQECADDVALIWRPHPIVAGSAHLFERDLWLEYRDIVEQYRMEGWGILDENWDSTLTVAVADAYYGDPDIVSQRCRNQGKPVMIENVAITEE